MDFFPSILEQIQGKDLKKYVINLGGDCFWIRAQIQAAELKLRFPGVFCVGFFLRTEYTPTFRGFESFYGYYDAWWNLNVVACTPGKLT